MSKEEDTSTDSNQENLSNILKEFQERVANMDEHTDELGCVGAHIFIWAVLFTILSTFGFFSQFLLFLATTLMVGAIAGTICSLILYSFFENWFVGALGYVLPFIAMVWIVFPALETSLNITIPDTGINIAIHAVLSLLILIFSKRTINKKERADHELRISSKLRFLLKDYDSETLDSDLCVMLDEAVQDRIDIHDKIYLSNDHDDLLEEIGVLEDVDDALCILVKQAKTIMQFRKRVSRVEKEDSGASSDDHLHSKLNEHMDQFTRKKTVLHELTLDVLGMDNEQIAMGIQALEKKREEVALLEKIRRDLL